MSYHILNITTSDVALYCEKGFLFCKYNKDDRENKIPIADLRALIIATHQVTFTNSCLARLMENKIIILHCNDKYQPTGWSAGIDTVIRTKVFFNQIARNNDFENKLWHRILRQKINNQTDNLDLLGCADNDLQRLIEREKISEGNIAKQYWQKYFACLGVVINREHQNAEIFENICLNYGYAVFSTLIYRAVLVHGLLPNLGVHHKEKYGSVPLVYDLLEPFRTFVDFYLKKFQENNEIAYREKNMRIWNKYLATCLRNYKLKAKGMSYKILDFVDIYVEDIANAFLNFDHSQINWPNIKAQYFELEESYAE